ncbi:MAG: hypothetical protein VKS61_10140 [Candidatus Sericytochromatia bacterium]|nr:hypothetical protein [Candidatus Sericytochromatia bacterium]
MKLRTRAPFLICLALLAACDGQSREPMASPSPSALQPGLSLRDALPSPTPNQALPSMPPPLMGAFVFYEDFERGISRWRIEGGKGGVGWHLLHAATCGGRYTMVLGREMNPVADLVAADALLTLRAPLKLPAGVPLQLKYDLKGTVAPPEASRITAELRGGQGPWQPAAPTATARYPLMVSYRVDLTPRGGQQVWLRFRGATRKALGKHKGFYLDDIQVLQGGAS